jgi:hypothetical protein
MGADKVSGVLQGPVTSDGRFMLRRSVPLLIVLWVAGCANPARQTWKIDDPAIMKATLSEQIPIGSSLSEARRYMESEGFECSDVLNGKFIERTQLSDDQPRYEGFDFIRGVRRQSAGFPVERIWSVAVVHDGSLVTDVLVRQDFVGP